MPFTLGSVDLCTRCVCRLCRKVLDQIAGQIIDYSIMSLFKDGVVIALTFQSDCVESASL